MKIKIFFLLVSIVILYISCQSTLKTKNMETGFDKPPSWAEEAIWYQIFVERFYNADPENDPTLETTYKALYDSMPSDWHITPWSYNWYAQENWAKKTELDFYRTIQMRRYGGDLKGVLAKIPYLKDLGINAIYFNPLNDAPSLHKYDARSYHHIDVTFGPDPIGDMQIIASENPVDPNTWKWTSADKMFLELVDSLHAAGIRVILDFSWNHTGNTFWAFRDIQENLNDSPYKDWYEGEVVKDENTGAYSYTYQGWHGINSLPEWKKVDTEGKISGHPYEGNLHPGVKQHIFDVCRRWMDPYGKGEVHRGIDGMRLDVAEHVPMGFWREFRKFVRSVNPDFYLVGENWWTEWPHQLMDASPWVKGDVFDAVMHYQWYKVARGFFGKTEDRVYADRFGFLIDSVFGKLPKHTQMAMMNLSASHDTPRLLTCMYNKGLYKHYCKPQENPQYLTQKPDKNTYHQVKLLLLHQFTFIGAPHIWNGDELGMWGADDPDNRKPLWWPEKSFDHETASTFSDYTYHEQVQADMDMLNYYKSLIALRKNNPTLIRGDYAFMATGNELVAYTRTLGKDTILIIFNNEEKRITI
jgi:cyclomaltodextrinase / maltogenic alpha-amylase / neopullulanase